MAIPSPCNLTSCRLQTRAWHLLQLDLSESGFGPPCLPQPACMSSAAPSLRFLLPAVRAAPGAQPLCQEQLAHPPLSRPSGLPCSALSLPGWLTLVELGVLGDVLGQALLHRPHQPLERITAHRQHLIAGQPGYVMMTTSLHHKQHKQKLTRTEPAPSGVVEAHPEETPSTVPATQLLHRLGAGRSILAAQKNTYAEIPVPSPCALKYQIHIVRGPALAVRCPPGPRLLPQC